MRNKSRNQAIISTSIAIFRDNSRDKEEKEIHEKL